MISAEKLTKKFGEYVAVNEINIKVKSG
ncbi:hypothetical protein C7380_105159, partial [Oceanotoga teriensis]